MSYSDSLTERNFKYLVSTSPVSSEMAAGSIPAIVDLAEKATGHRPKTIAVISDSVLPAQSYVKALREKVLPAARLELVVDEVFNSPLTDATSMIQRVRMKRPDLMLFYTATVTDAKLALEKFNEFGLNESIPVVTVATFYGSPEMLKAIGPKLLEKMIVVATNWSSKQHAKLADSLAQRSGEPWITEDLITGYGQVWLAKDAIERAGSIEHDAVTTALKATNLTDGHGPAQYFIGGGLKFAENGRRIGAPIVLLQWQNGKPVTVSPVKDAFTDLVWPKK
jgi:branched-chain amino acid transport system substrate-binding protein